MTELALIAAIFAIPIAAATGYYAGRLPWRSDAQALQRAYDEGYLDAVTHTQRFFSATRPNDVWPADDLAKQPPAGTA